MSRLRLAPIGLSVLVNLALIGLMARVLVSAPAAETRYIAVELRAPSTFNVQRPKPVVKQSAASRQQPVPPVRRSKFDVQRSTFKAPTVHRSPFTVHRPAEVAGLQQIFTSGGGGTSATGPGAAVGPGPGGGTSGSGESTTTTPQPSPAPNTEPSTSNVQPPPPKPRGESRAPSVAEQTKPIYPQDARDDGTEGTAVILALISPEGKVTDTRLEKSSGDRRLDQAAVDAVLKWTYNPCLKDGAPVKSSVRVRVEFRLE
jgi:TonB family protein